jgi:Icc-related predicted phosphoesterase
MRLHAMSDLHLELHRDQGMEFLKGIPSGQANVLILAGDICSLKHDYWPTRIYEDFCRKYPEVLMIPGNHEYYGASVQKVEKILCALEARFPNLHVLRRGEVQVVNSQRFLGDTLWFPFEAKNPWYYDQIWDFDKIQGFTPWVYQRNTQVVTTLRRELQAGDIVVSHHLPSALSIHPKFAGSNINRFFLCDLSDLIVERQPKLWIHGHSHELFDYQLGQTRIYSNPLGYPSELSPMFDQRLLVEV